MSEKRQFFGTDGVRAVANRHPMSPEFVMRLGQAAAAVLGGQSEGGERPRCIIGRDTRASGEMLEAALIAGLNSCGVDVVLAGMVPTPTVAMLAAQTGANFGVIVSASHNPFQDNGIKCTAMAASSTTRPRSPSRRSCSAKPPNLRAPKAVVSAASAA
jgi:phosphoglucosamine mutase